MVDVLRVVDLAEQLVELVVETLPGDEQTCRRWETEKLVAGNGDRVVPPGIAVTVVPKATSGAWAVNGR